MRQEFFRTETSDEQQRRRKGQRAGTPGEGFVDIIGDGRKGPTDDGGKEVLEASAPSRVGQKILTERPEATMEKPEKESRSRVILSFFRHGKKEKTGGGQSDYDVPLTIGGREQAHSKGIQIRPQEEVSIAIGSPRERAQETAARIMLADDFPPEATSKEIKAKVQEELDNHYKLGPGRVKKISTDARLDFFNQGEFEEHSNQAYGEKRYLDFLVNESDDLVIKTGDEKSSSMTRNAANVAELIKKYLSVSNTFDEIVRRKPKKYAPYGNQIERYLGTHLSIGESFLAKVISKTRGELTLKEWVAKNPAGLAETEGFCLEIIPGSTPGQEVIFVRFRFDDNEETIEIKPELLDEIIQERVEFDKKITEAKK